MKKENILVVALILIAVGSVLAFNRLKAPESAGSPHTAVEPPAAEPAPMASAGRSGAPAAVSDRPAGIDWKNYTPGLATARTENKSVFLYFHAPWCTYCKQLKETTFKDDTVLAYLREHFISIQVDTDENRSLAAEWQVRGLPTLWFLEPDGSKINNLPGYVSAPQLLLILKYIHTKSYTRMDFQEFMKQS